jgi:FkbM family methyltransferase
LKTARSKELFVEYWRAGEKLLEQYPNSISLDELDGFLLPWLASLGQSPLKDARPWITFAAARFLEQQVSLDSRVFEYGAGGSTLFFSQRVTELVTVEHDRQWLQETASKVRWHPARCWRAHLVQPVARSEPMRHDADDPEAYASTDPRFRGMSFRHYASTIDRYPDNYFDVVLIDGRSRPACFKHAVAKVKFGGLIVLDNAERPQYAFVEEAARKLGFETAEFWGPGPYNLYFWRTLVLRKVRARFSLGDLDQKLEKYLDFDGGTFVEAGANDGVNQSNSFYFEAKRGWRGMLVEPIFQRAEECRRLRPHAVVEHAALIPAGSEHRLTTLRYANLMSVVKGGMHSSDEEDEHIAAGCNVQAISTYEFSAPTATLSELLEKHRFARIDLLSLDVEGYEASVLRGLDFSRHRPRYILVEARYAEEIAAVLSDRYELVAQLSHHDVLYRLRNDAERATVKADRSLTSVVSSDWGGVPRCIACDTPMVEHYRQMFDDRYGYPGYFSLHRCPECRQIQTLPLLDDGDLPSVYGNYYPRREIDVAALQRAAVDATSKAERRRMWYAGTYNQGHYAARPGMAVLDYGCGAGQSLLELQKLGTHAYGLETDPNVKQVVDALGLRIHIGSIDDNPFPGVRFDLIVLNQVFEHIPQPALLLPKLAARLKPGGRVILSFPNSASVFARRFGREWINWHIPYHLHHFNPASTRRFFKRHGWKVESLRTITPNLWTVLQMRAAVERTRMGVPNPLWTGVPASEPIELEAGSSQPSHSLLKLHAFALRANEARPRRLLTAFNRLIDAVGLGDSILVTVRPSQHP